MINTFWDPSVGTVLSSVPKLIRTNPSPANASDNTAAINTALAQGGDYYISGTVPINGSILNKGGLGLFGSRLYGFGSWGSSIRQGLGGTVLQWVGPAGLPMYVHQCDFGGGLFGILFKGQTSAPPLCAMLLDSGKYSVVTNSYTNPSENRNCTEGTFDQIWIGQSLGIDSDATNSQFTNGIMFTGTINGDTHKFGMVMIMGVTGTGILNQNPNAAGISFDTLLIKHSTNCIDTTSNMTLRNLYCTATDYSLILRDTGALVIDTLYIENGGGLFTFLAGTLTNYNNNFKQSLWVRNGSMQILASGNTSPYIGDVTTSTQWTLRLEDFDFQAPFINPQIPIINLANAGNVNGCYKLDLKSTSISMSLASNVIAGTSTKGANFLSCRGGDTAVPAASPGFINSYGLSTNSSTLAALQLIAADVYQGESDTHALSLTGAITAASVATLPTVASLLAAVPNAVVGQTFRLRFINKGGSGSGVWSVSGTYGGSYLNLTSGGTPAWDTSTQKFGTAALAAPSTNGYGFSSAFPSWPGTNATIQCWVKKATPPSASCYTVSFDNGTTVSAYILVLTSGVSNYGYESAGINYSFSDTINICDGAWHLQELDITPTGIQFFLDGSLRTTASAHVPDAVQGPNFAIGVRARTFTLPWQGEIDEVSIWNTNLHTTSYTPPVSAWTGAENNLVELYHLDSNFTSTVTPSGGGGWTINGGASIAVGAYRDFIVTITSLGGSPTATLQAFDGL